MNNDENKELCRKFIWKFVDDVLGGNLDKLKTFSFLNLKTDENKKYFNKEIDIEFKHKYGYFNIIKYKTYDCIDYKLRNSFEDCDDMNIVRAINFLLYSDKLPDFKFDDIRWEKYYGENIEPKYRGETINTFNTLINEHLTKKGNFYYEEFFDKAFADEITKFKFELFTIGNFMLLPNYSYQQKGWGKSKTLNTYKGSELGDYSDKFLNLLKNPNEVISNLKKKNAFYFNEIDFEKFIKINYLKDYTDEKGDVNFNFSPYYRYWNIDNKEKYKNFIEKYMEETRKKVNSRADRIMEDLEKLL